MEEALRGRAGQAAANLDVILHQLKACFCPALPLPPPHSRPLTRPPFTSALPAVPPFLLLPRAAGVGSVPLSFVSSPLSSPCGPSSSGPLAFKCPSFPSTCLCDLCCPFPPTPTPCCYLPSPSLAQHRVNGRPGARWRTRAAPAPCQPISSSRSSAGTPAALAMWTSSGSPHASPAAAVVRRGRRRPAWHTAPSPSGAVRLRGRRTTRRGSLGLCAGAPPLPRSRCASESIQYPCHRIRPPAPPQHTLQKLFAFS